MGQDTNTEQGDLARISAAQQAIVPVWVLDHVRSGGRLFPHFAPDLAWAIRLHIHCARVALGEVDKG